MCERKRKRTPSTYLELEKVVPLQSRCWRELLTTSELLSFWEHASLFQPAPSSLETLTTNTAVAKDLGLKTHSKKLIFENPKTLFKKLHGKL